MMISLFNQELLKELRDIMQDDFVRLFEVYLRDSEDKIAKLATAIGSKDAELTMQLAHSFKGSSCNIGADLVASSCQALETAAREKQLTLWQPLLDVIRQSFDSTKKQIESDILK